MALLGMGRRKVSGKCQLYNGIQNTIQILLRIHIYPYINMHEGKDWRAEGKQRYLQWRRQQLRRTWTGQAEADPGQMQEIYTLDSQTTPHSERGQKHLPLFIHSSPFIELKGAKAFYYYCPVIQVTQNSNQALLMEYLWVSVHLNSSGNGNNL